MLNPENKFHAYLLKMGFTNDYNVTYSLNQIGPDLVEQIDFMSIPKSAMDIRWLANKVTKAMGKTKDSCIDNFRACYIPPDGKASDDYNRRLGNGCCGFHDQVVINELTGNKYKIGFNYGH